MHWVRYLLWSNVEVTHFMVPSGISRPSESTDPTPLCWTLTACITLTLTMHHERFPHRIHVDHTKPLLLEGIVHSDVDFWKHPLLVNSLRLGTNTCSFSPFLSNLVSLEEVAHNLY